MQNTLTKIPSHWNNVPKVATRSELLEERKKNNLPDRSFDIDTNSLIINQDSFINPKLDSSFENKSNSELTSNKNVNPVLGTQQFTRLGQNRSFHTLRSKAYISSKDDFTTENPVHPNNHIRKAKSKSELEAQRKAETRANAKFFESKIKNEYFREETLPFSPTNTSQHRDYRQNPTFKTKEEMLKLKKNQLLEDLNNSCSYNHKTQYERILIREHILETSPGRDSTPIHEKLRQQNMQHFLDTFGKRPVGLHKAQLPKFSEHLKEYWKHTPQSSSNKLSSAKQSKIVDLEKRDKPKRIRKKEERFEKPNEVEFNGVSVEREHCRNSKWTGYHYRFLKKGVLEEKRRVRVRSEMVEEESLGEVEVEGKPEIKKVLIAQRMIRKGSFSPGRDQFRSTGFAFSQD